jgi:hypothetical protein
MSMGWPGTHGRARELPCSPPPVPGPTPPHLQYPFTPTDFKKNRQFRDTFPTEREGHPPLAYERGVPPDPVSRPPLPPTMGSWIQRPPPPATGKEVGVPPHERFPASDGDFSGLTLISLAKWGGPSRPGGGGYPHPLRLADTPPTPQGGVGHAKGGTPRRG